MAGKARERKEPRNTRNRTSPWGKELPYPVHIFRAFSSTLTKGGGHFRFAYYELKEAVGTSFRLVHERHHHGLLAVADEKRPTRRMVSPSDPLAMVALGHKAMLGNKWCLGCTFITWSMRSRNDDLDCEACLWPRWMRSSCRFRKGSRVRDEKQEKKKKEKKGKKRKTRGTKVRRVFLSNETLRYHDGKNKENKNGLDEIISLTSLVTRFGDSPLWTNVFNNYLGYTIFPDG